MIFYAGKRQKNLVKQLIERCYCHGIRVCVCDRSPDPCFAELQHCHGSVDCRIIINDKKFYSALKTIDAFELGRAYIMGWIDIQGDLQFLSRKLQGKLFILDKRIPFFKRRQFKGDQRASEKKNIAFHYDLPSSFYRLFLGETLGYTCGYYQNDLTTLDESQRLKMHIVCRKLNLKKGEKLVDIGCGWGGFIIEAAKAYGADVTGITLSQSQADFTKAWIRKEGLEDHCRVKIMNYRDLPEDNFDKAACIGMSEHVGHKYMPLFLNKVQTSLKPGGLFLLHTITANRKKPPGCENTLLQTYMFPGGQLLLLHELLHCFAQIGLELLSSENFRLHYIRTLHDWILNLERNRFEVLKIVSEAVYRLYYLFFIGSRTAFDVQDLSVHQLLFYKKCRPEPYNYFLTRFLPNATFSA